MPLLNRRNFVLSLPLIAPGVVSAQKTLPPFQAGEAADFKHKMSAEGVTIGVRAFNEHDECEAVFGKKRSPLPYKVLPVLVVIDNQSKNTISLVDAEVEMIRQEVHLDPIPVEEISFAKRARNPSQQSPLPIPIPWPRGKNPLADDAFQVRALRAKIIPAGEKANGFLYFFTPYREGFTLFIRGLKNAKTGQELFYFEVPVEGLTR
jgi:hypothetical protein